MLVSMTQLGTYDQAKTMLKQQLHFKEGIGLHLGAALCSGVCYSAISLPVDNAKTRLQNQRRLPDGTLPLTSVRAALGATVSEQGALALW
jgi:solute carrier family 25 oxoglutarate transporter 11